MAKRYTQQRSEMTLDYCQLCGKPTGILKANHPKFKQGRAYSSGICEPCRKMISEMAAILAQGGVLLVCIRCYAVSATREVPSEFLPFIAVMPDGTKRLEIAGCNLCTKEARNALLDITSHDPSASVA